MSKLVPLLLPASAPGHPSRASILCTVLLALLTGACSGATNKAPESKCVRAGDQCQLPSGPLGVCSLVDCKEGQAPPCLVCMSQH